MPGSRPSQFKHGSGGFLNDVDGVIVSQEFTYQFGDNEPKRGEETKNIYSALTVRQDGADEDVTVHLYVGSGEFGDNDRYFTISDDATALEASDDDMAIWGESPWAGFINSLVVAGFPDTLLPEEEISYQAIVGTRVRFVQVEEIDKATGKVRMRKAKKGKFKGREFKQTTTQVSKVLALPGEKPEKGKSASKTNGSGGRPTQAVSSGKKSKTTTSPSEDDIEALAAETLLAILEANGGSIDKAKLPVKVLNKLGAKHPQKEEIRRVLYTDDFLATEQGWTYDKASKKQTITVAEAE